MNIIHRGKLKHLEFTFVVGDLFDAEVDAIVSSYGWFTEGFDTLDLKEAKTLLDELHA
jgi:hypothetical protein